MRNLLPGSTIFAGDFNIDRFRDGGIEQPLYQSILDSDFIDAYADVQTDPLNSLCDEPSNPDEHCTVGVSELDGSNARRIDYFFAGEGDFANVSFGEVVFNPLVDPTQETVSDHAGVWAGFEVPMALVASLEEQ